MQSEFLILLYLLTNAFRTYVIYRFMGIFLDQTVKNRRLQWIAYISFFLIVSFVYLFINIPLLTMFVNLGGLLFLSSFYDSRWKLRLFAAVACYAIFVCTEVITVVFFGALNFSVTSSNEYSSVPAMIMTNLIPFAFSLALEKYLNQRKREEISPAYWLAVFCIPASSIFLTVIIVKSYGLSSGEIMFSVLILLSLNVFVFYLYDAVNNLEVKKREQIALNQQHEYYKKQYELMQASLESSRLLRHDLKNHQFILCELLEHNEFTQAIEYVKNMLGDTYIKGEFAHSGCMEIDCMLNFKLQAAEMKGIQVDLSLEVLSDLSVDPLDLAIVFGNLLDNAIEGASTAEKKWMRISIHNKRKLLFLKITNSYDGISLPNHQTRKEDTENHGLGLKSVQRVIEKNNGEIILNQDSEQFTVTVLMYLK